MKRTIFLLLGLLAATLFFSCKKEEPVPGPDIPVVLDCVKPDYLRAGDRVALISPSFYDPMEDVEETADILRSWGLEPVIGPNVGKIYGGMYAGTVEERVSDIRWALRDPSIKAIICNTGGYGTIQLIDKLTLSELKASPKWFVGFSDITTLLGLFNRAGVMSVHGTMSMFIAAGGDDETARTMRDILLGTIPEYKVPAHPQNILGSATGTLVGGNLCTFTPNLGTRADATAGEDIILFIEEVEESIYNIDRQMRILQLNGVLDRCKGVILGEFPYCGEEFVDENGQTTSIEELLHNILEPYGIPVLCGFPAGHGDVNLPLVMGAPVSIDVSSSGSTISFRIDGQKREIKIFSGVRNAEMSPGMRMMLSGRKSIN